MTADLFTAHMRAGCQYCLHSFLPTCHYRHCMLAMLCRWATGCTVSLSTYDLVFMRRQASCEICGHGCMAAPPTSDCLHRPVHKQTLRWRSIAVYRLLVQGRTTWYQCPGTHQGCSFAEQQGDGGDASRHVDNCEQHCARQDHIEDVARGSIAHPHPAPLLQHQGVD